LVVDDILVDDQPHEYLWQMQVPWDVAIWRSDGQDIMLSGGNDKMAAASEKTPEQGDPLLLVRVIERDNSAAKTPNTPMARLHVDSSRLHEGNKDSAHFNRTIWGSEAADRRPRPHHPDKTLMIPARAVKGTFKVLLYPYCHGHPLPKTTYDGGTGQLTVTLGKRTQTITFAQAATGKTNITVQEAGKKPMELERPLPEQPNRPSQPLTQPVDK
jgi:hypothetical protein